MIVFDFPVLSTIELHFVDRLRKISNLDLVFLKKSLLRKHSYFIQINLYAWIECRLQKSFKLSRDFLLLENKFHLVQPEILIRHVELSHYDLIINLSTSEIKLLNGKVISIRNELGREESIYEQSKRVFVTNEDHVVVSQYLNEDRQRQMRYEVDKLFINNYLILLSRNLFYIIGICRDLL